MSMVNDSYFWLKFFDIIDQIPIGVGISTQSNSHTIAKEITAKSTVFIMEIYYF